LSSRGPIGDNANKQASQPLVSVIVPVYNGERFLAQALDSVLAQDYRPLEIIVVDDGSVDGTAAIARSREEVRYIHQTNQGHPAALNAGLTVAGGDLIAFLDADDQWTPNKLTVQIDHLLAHPEVMICLAHTRNVLEPGVEQPEFRTRDLLLDEAVLLALGATVVRRAVFERISVFDTQYGHAKDVDWFVRAREAGIEMAIVPQTLLLRRLHADNRSYRTRARTAEFLRVVKAAIERRRENEGGAGVA
jgi:glycosyltransferase involved in cell wall biosynthesis